MSALFLHITAAFSEAWRDALKELAAKVHLSAQEQKDKKEVGKRFGKAESHTPAAIRNNSPTL